MISSIVGKLYPIKDETGIVVNYKPITKATMLENASGIVISLSEQEPSIIISFGEALSLKEGKND